MGCICVIYIYIYISYMRYLIYDSKTLVNNIPMR